VSSLVYANSSLASQLQSPILGNNMDEYPSDQPQMEASHTSKHTVAWILVTVIVIVVGFIGISAYLHRPTTGTVIHVSATDITVRPNGSSVAKTFSITKATQMVLAQSTGIGLRPQPFKASDIRVGDTIEVAGPSNNQAQAIVVNPLR